MLGQDEEALTTDAYIDSLLAAHGGQPVLLPEPGLLPPPAMRHSAELLANGLPRIHPSFRFEQQLAARLRQAALAQLAGRPLPQPVGRPLPQLAGLPLPQADVITFPTHIAGHPLPALAVDRRLLLGGAIASGVSLGAAVIAWRWRDRGRARRGWLA
jgi:hypothetical protein